MTRSCADCGLEPAVNPRGGARRYCRDCKRKRDADYQRRYHRARRARLRAEREAAKASIPLELAPAGATPKRRPNRLHPIFRCEECGYWVDRNGQPAPACPYCVPRGTKKAARLDRAVPMWPAMRAQPPGREGAYPA